MDIKTIRIAVLSLVTCLIIFIMFYKHIEPKENTSTEIPSSYVSKSSSSTYVRSSTPTSNSRLTHDKKLEILSYINGILDPLDASGKYTDDELEEKANQVWADAEEKYNVTENDIATIMMDTDLVNEYYSGGSKNDNNNETVTTYDATLAENGYCKITIAATDDALDEYTKAIMNNDDTKIGELLADSKISYAEDGTKVDIVKTGIGSCEVKILDGAYKDNTAYVISEQVQMK